MLNQLKRKSSHALVPPLNITIGATKKKRGISVPQHKVVLNYKNKTRGSIKDGATSKRSPRRFSNASNRGNNRNNLE